MMARRMRMKSFQKQQMDDRYLPHIEPFNRMVDELSTVEEWMPYVAPLYGGINARVLAIFRDPGPKTQVGSGSGMLCVENDDQSAERHYNFLKNAGIEHDQLMVWNTYPWYINRKPSSQEIDRGLGPLKQVVSLCPNLEVVMAHGGEAQVAWQRFRLRNPDLVRDITTIETYHTSRQALQTNVPGERERRERKLVDDFARASARLRGE
ncbi:hypothetical protein BJF87_24680 [Gordonia sp. CNJ-863]|nr:hypothetical protein BJF87_24680 [Gordonia sp. CNJ-863]